MILSCLLPPRLRLAASLLALATVHAAPPVAADKSGYTLFKPTPERQLRELTTDRPDTTESPFTIDAGHAQVEMDFANLTRNRRDGARSTEWGAVPFNLRLGLLNHFEVGVFVSPYVRRAETPRGGPRETHAGFGDVTLRGKFNFWGNDGGGTAGGLIVNLTLPVATAGLGSGKTEGAIILPLVFELAGGWEGGAMTVAEFRSRGVGGGYRTVWNNTVTVGHEIVKDFSGYVELTSSAGDGAHVATFDFGVTWKLSAHTQLDCGARAGISRAADDLGVFAGISRRF